MGAFALLASAFLASAALSGCSMAVPAASTSAMWGKAHDDVTGSIRKKDDVRLSGEIDGEDWRRASAALNTALDPQGSGASVNWDNPQSGARGSFTPAGFAYPLEGKVCRAFVAEVGTKGGHEKLRGTACRDKAVEWTLTEVSSRTKS